MKAKHVFLGVALMTAYGVYSQDNRNYVTPTDPNLVTEVKYNNPMRNMWSVGGNVGVDISAFAGGVYGELTGYFAPKRLTFKGSYAFDLSNSDFISKSNLYDLGNKYGNLQVTGIFNYKDEISEYNASPTVGFDVTDVSVSGNVKTTTGYMYKTDLMVQRRVTRGIGGTFMNQSMNCFYAMDKVDTTQEFITLANNSALPTSFVLPFSTTTFGFSFQMAEYVSTKVKYKYKSLPRYKFKQNYYKLVNFELLFSPSVRNGDNIFYNDANGVAQSLAVQDVKKRRIGFRIVATTNQFKKFQGKPGLYMNGEVGLRTGIFPSKAGDAENKAFVNKLISQPFYMKWGIGFAF